jgi:hypothetical protein
VELCTTETTSALPTVFRRAIAERVHTGFGFENAILPAMLRLIVGLVSRCTDIPSENVAATRNAFESVLRLARKLVMEFPDNEAFLSDGVARFLVSRLALAGNECKFRGAVDSTSIFEVLVNNSKEESDAVGAARVSNNRFTHRTRSIDDALRILDWQKVEAKRSSRTAQRALKAVAIVASAECVVPESHRVTAPATNIDVDDLGQEDVAVAMFGEDCVGVLHRRRAELVTLRRTAATSEGCEETEGMKDLMQSAEEHKSERQRVAQRIAELRQSIENLEIYDAELCSKIVEIEAEIDKNCQSRAKAAGRIQADLAQATRAANFDSSVIDLVDLLKTYDGSLYKAGQEVHCSG